MPDIRFSLDEIRLLMKGLDSIEKAESQSEMMSGLLGAMLSKSEEDAKKRAEELETKMKASEEKREQMRERIILLKAKVLLLKDSETADEFLKQALSG